MTSAADRPIEPRRLVRGAPTRLAYLLQGLFGYSISSIGPILPRLQSDLRIGYAATSLHASLFNVGLALVGQVAGHLVARFGRATTLRLGMLVMAAGLLLLALAGSLAVTLPAALLAGAGGSCILVIVPAVLSDEHGRDRAAAYAESTAVASAASFFAPLLVGASIALGAGWRPGFAIPPLLGAVAILLLHRRTRLDAVPRSEAEGPLPTTPAAPPTPAPHPAAASRIPRAIRRHLLMIVLVVGAEWAFNYWIAAWLGDRLGVDPATAAIGVAPFSVGMVVARLLLGRLALRHASEGLLLAGIALGAVGFGLLWTADSLPVALLGVALGGAGLAGLYPLSLGLLVEAAGEATAAASARAAFASGLAGSTSPFLLGFLADRVGLSLAYLVVPVLLGATTLGVLAGRLTRGDGRAARPRRTLGPSDDQMEGTAR